MNQSGRPAGGYDPRRGGTAGRYGAPAGAGIPGRGGGPGIGAGSSRSSAAQQAQARLRALMSTGTDDSPEEYAAPPVGMQIPGRNLQPSMRMPVGGPSMARTRSTTGDGYYDGPERGVPLPGVDAGRRMDGVPRQEVESLRREAAKLKDDVDVLSEENEYLVDKLRVKEEELQEVQARAKELEKQVASMGEGISLEARLLNKKEQALKQREATLKEMKDKSKDTKDVEVTSLRMELEAQKEETVAAVEEAKKAAQEVGALRSLTSRIVLTAEEKEEVVLKRCWLSRYWALASKMGVHPKIAGPRMEYWQKFSPLPFEVVLDAGRKAREEPREGDTAKAAAAAALRASGAVGTDSIESMFQVEKALRDLASLKVEEAVLLAMAQHRRPALLKVQSVPTDGPRMVESMDLSEEEAEDVRFKQNWLVYWWRRAKSHGVEPDIASERLHYWMSRSNVKPTAHDAVDVDRGLIELRELNLEQQLWDTSRKEMSDGVSTISSDVPRSVSAS